VIVKGVSAESLFSAQGRQTIRGLSVVGDLPVFLIQESVDTSPHVWECLRVVHYDDTAIVYDFVLSD